MEDLRFRDEDGQPSDRFGPDLSSAMPLNMVVSNLDRHWADNDPDSYAYVLIDACAASGVSVDLYIDAGGANLWFGFPFDCQEELRRPRFDALVGHLRDDDQRRSAVIDYLRYRGKFLDRRRFESPAQAATEILALRGRLFIVDYGPVEIAFDGTITDEVNEGFPRRSLFQRWTNSLRHDDFDAQIRAWVMENGTSPSNGQWVVRAEGAAS